MYPITMPISTDYSLNSVLWGRPAIPVENGNIGDIKTPKPINDCHKIFEDSDDQLFHRVQYVNGHVLQPQFPDRRTNCHALSDRRHDFLLSCRLNSLTDSNFMIRQLFKDCYWLWFYTCMYSVFTFLFFSMSGCCSMSDILTNEYVCMTYHQAHHTTTYWSSAVDSSMTSRGLSWVIGMLR